MLRAIVDGQTDVQDLAQLAKGRLVHKLPQLEEALLGKVRDHHRFLIQQHLNHLEFLEAQIIRFNQHIEQSINAHSNFEPLNQSESESNSSDSDSDEPTETASTLSWTQAVSLADTIPGVAQNTAELLVAEIGTDMSRFPSASPKS